jgi:hypothetical protein
MFCGGREIFLHFALSRFAKYLMNKFSRKFDQLLASRSMPRFGAMLALQGHGCVSEHNHPDERTANLWGTKFVSLHSYSVRC